MKEIYKDLIVKSLMYTDKRLVQYKAEVEVIFSLTIFLSLLGNVDLISSEE